MFIMIDEFLSRIWIIIMFVVFNNLYLDKGGRMGRKCNYWISKEVR